MSEIAVVFLAALAVFAAALLAMAIPARVSGRCLRGSCGGRESRCPGCPRRGTAADDEGDRQGPAGPR